MNRFLIDKSLIRSGSIEITDREDVHHLAAVLRLKEGESLFVSDGDGGGYVTRAVSVSRRAVVLRVTKALKRKDRSDASLWIALACAVPKNVAFEDIVDKCAQLGVQEIIPLATERTFWDRESVEKKRSRFERVLRRAGKQSGALFLPQLKPTISFKEFLAQSGSYGLRLIPNLAEGTLTLPQALTEKKRATDGRILIAIGPEGDFTDKELKAAFGAGFKGVSLGDSVLRVDTAAIASVAFIRLLLGQ